MRAVTRWDNFRLYGWSGTASIGIACAITGAVRTKHSVSLPGASPDRWPNWSLALPISQEELEQHDLARGIAQALKQGL